MGPTTLLPPLLPFSRRVRRDAGARPFPPLPPSLSSSSRSSGAHPPESWGARRGGARTTGAGTHPPATGRTGATQKTTSALTSKCGRVLGGAASTGARHVVPPSPEGPCASPPRHPGGAARPLPQLSVFQPPHRHLPSASAVPPLPRLLALGKGLHATPHHERRRRGCSC